MAGLNKRERKMNCLPLININKTKDLKDLVEIINEAANGCGIYATEEVDKFLYESRLTDREGCFLTNPDPSKKKAVDYLVYHI